MKIRVHPERYAIARLDPDAASPAWAGTGPLSFLARTPGELSVIALEASVPAGARHERGLMALEVAGPLELGLVGILARIATVLAAARVPILAQSTFDTDYVFVREGDLNTAVAALRADGIVVEP